MQFCERSGQRKTSAPDVGRALGREFDIGLKPSKNPASRSLTDNKQFVAIDDQAFQIGLIVMTSYHVDPWASLRELWPTPDLCARILAAERPLRAELDHRH